VSGKKMEGDETERRRRARQARKAGHQPAEEEVTLGGSSSGATCRPAPATRRSSRHDRPANAPAATRLIAIAVSDAQCLQG
jgi:hypothetical protein